MDLAEHQPVHRIFSDQRNHGDDRQTDHDGDPDHQVIAIDGRDPSHGDPSFSLQTA
jgi:hypothetical protein